MSDLLIAPAKVNHYLAITGKREDGFHSLESLVLPLLFGDNIQIEFADKDLLTCSDSELPCGAENLIWMAVKAYREHTGFTKTLRIHLEKKIPSGAGLGGGSSDASSVLAWLNEQNCQPVAQVELEAILAKVGSDCPLFLRKKPIVMKGRGEILSGVDSRALGDLYGKRVILFKPHFSISTVWAYKSLAQTRAYHDSELLYNSTGNLMVLPECFNSFEVTTFKKYPVYQVLKNALESKGLPRFLLSGSGSACFAYVDEADSSLYEEIVKSILGDDCFFVTTSILT